MTPGPGNPPAATRGPNSAATGADTGFAESCAVGILCIAAVVGPLACGGTGAAARLGLEVAAALAALLWCVSSPRPFLFPVVPLAMSALVLLQLVPLPDRLLGSLAPVSMSLWKISRAGLNESWGTVSVNPSATAKGMMRLLLGLATVAVVTDLARKSRYRRWLCGAIIAVGALVWMAGFMFPVDPRQHILLGFMDLKGPIKWWLTPIEAPRATAGVGELTPVNLGAIRYQVNEGNIGDGFGSYVYSNHFAGAMCLTLPLLLAGWLAVTAGRLPNWVRVAVAGALAAGGLWTNWSPVGSRAGTLSLAGAIIMLAALTVRGRWLGRATRACAVAYAGGLVFLLGAMHGPFRGLVAVLPEWFQLHAAPMLADPRVWATEVALRMFSGCPFIGTGLGTYDDMNGHIVRGRFVSYFAHNDYAQLFGETGLVGALVGLIAASMVFRAFRRFRAGGPPDDAVLRAGAWAAVAGIVVHSCFDWNLHLAANALLAAVTLGLAWSSAEPSSDTEPATWRQSSVIVAVMFCLACTAAILFLGRDAASDTIERQLRTAITADRLAMAGSDRLAAAPRLNAAIERGEVMAGWDPGNAGLAMLLGQAYLHLAAAQRGGAEVPPEAERWFARARVHAAACRGFPEPIVRRPSALATPVHAESKAFAVSK